MVDAYRSDAWQLLFASVAAASAALTGLLFVGLSMSLRRVVGTPEHLARARESFGQLLSLLVLSVILLIPGQNRLLLGTELIDRKSTRLNSSHVSISYAVFCLKK